MSAADQLAENMQQCPIDGCDAVFDVVEAAYVGTDAACPGCDATWKQLCRAVEPKEDAGEVEIKRNFDGSTEIVEGAQ